MTKKLRYFCTLLLMAVVGVAWAQTSVTWSGATSLPGTATNVGDDENITIMTSSTNTYSNPIRVYANTTVTIKALNGAKITSITYEASSTGNYVANAQNAVVSPNVTPTVSDKIITWTYSETDNVTEFTFTPSAQTRCNSITVTYVSNGGSTAVATTTAIDASGITNTDVYTDTAAGSLTATVTETESGNAVSGATVTWTSSKENVATIDENGVVTLVAAGTTTITATYAGVSGEFGSSSATYDLTVTSSAPYEQPTTIEITPNYEFWGQNAQFSGNTYDELSGEKDNVTLEWSRGSGSTYANTTAMRFYKDNTLTFTAPDGYEIKSIAITYSGTQTDLTFSPEGYANGTWTGSSATVTMSRPSNGTSYYTISKYTITLGEPSTDPTIEASNVNIAYDATSGEIAYTINNPVPGTLLQATADADWVSDITVGDEAITFTTTANEANTERVATFTLTYEGAEDKTVTVTQAAAPVVYTTIPDLFAAATSTSTPVAITFNNWVISAVKGSNAYLTDNAGNGLIIYQSGHGFNVNDVLSGTASCNLVTYQGSAELTALTASTEGLTVTAGGTVTEQNIAINELGGVNTGALLAYENLTFNGTALVDADNNAIEPYSTLYSYTFEADKVYNVKGIYKQYTTNTQDKKQILPRSADDIEEVVSEDPAVTLENYNIDVPVEGGDGILTVQYQNIDDVTADIQFYGEDGSEVDANYYEDWLTAELDEDNNVSYIAIENNGEERKAYFKVYSLVGNDFVYSNQITITQAAYEAPSYATLPFEFNEGKAAIEETDGLTQEGLGSDYNASSNPTTQLKFDGTGDWLLLQFDEEPGKLTFDIKGNGFSGGTFTVQTSEDGVTFTDLASYTELGATQNEEFKNLDANVRFIKWIYTEKVNGNVGLGNIKLEKPATTATITIKKDFTATTFSCDKALDFSNVEGITAFIITDDKGSTTPVTKVPAGKGLYIVGAEGNYEVPFLADETEADVVSANWLIPTDGTTEFKSDESVTYYAFGKQNGKEAFYKVPTSGYTPSANKAVLVVNAPASSAKEMIVIGGDVTGIESIENGTIVNDNYYTIDGKLVKGQPTEKGIYVVNGRKVVIK